MRLEGYRRLRYSIDLKDILTISNVIAKSIRENMLILMLINLFYGTYKANLHICVWLNFLRALRSFERASFRLSTLFDKILVLFSNSRYSMVFFISTGRHWKLVPVDDRFIAGSLFVLEEHMRDRSIWKLKYEKNKNNKKSQEKNSYLLLHWLKLLFIRLSAAVTVPNVMVLKHLK